MDRVGDYVFLRELGRGEQSQVYLARTPERLEVESPTVAVKVLTAPGPEGFDALADELGLVASLRSVRVVPLYEAGTEAGTVFYSMRHEAGGSLAAPARELTRRERLLAVASAAWGAHELHEAGVAHRGVGPTNVLLERGGAVLAEPAVGHLAAPGHAVSVLGTRAQAGRLELVDPALMGGRPAGRASDIWSLAVTLHLVLTGHGLFPALVSADPFTAVRIYLRSQPEPGEDLTDGERAVIVRALHPDHTRRYRTAAEFAAAVEGVAGR